MIGTKPAQFPKKAQTGAEPDMEESWPVNLVNFFRKLTMAQCTIETKADLSFVWKF